MYFPKFTKQEAGIFLLMTSLMGWAFWSVVFWLLSFLDVSIGLN